MRHQIKPCPLCGRPTSWENNPYAPFCSERCKLIDLGQWASEKYRIPGEKVPEKPAGEEESEKNNKPQRTQRKTK